MREKPKEVYLHPATCCKDTEDSYMTIIEWQNPVAAQQIRNIYCSISLLSTLPGMPG